jgi:hypothetical protein
MKLMHPASAFSPCFAIRSKWALPYLLAALTLVAGIDHVAGQGTAFIYQGGLNSNGAPVNGNYDFAFALYNDPLSGSQVGSAETNTAVTVSEALFATMLDFGSAPWTGQSLWLQILVRTNGDGAFSSLKPRQPMTSSPYAIQSLNAATAASASNAIAAVTANSANSVAATNLSGTILNSSLPSSPVFSGEVTASLLSGNGVGLTNLNPTNFGAGTAAINITGNAATATSASNVTGNIADFQLSTNVPLLNGTNWFKGTNSFSGVVVATNTNSVVYGTFTGNLSGNATTANSANLATNAETADNFSGSLSGDVTGTQGATAVASVGGQSAANVASGVSAANAATSTNTPGTIVMRDASGNFAAGAVTAGFLSGNGGGLTNLNAANLDGGTAAINITGNAATATSASNVTGNIADFQLSTNVPLLNGTNSFSGTNDFAGVTIATNTNNVINGTFTGNLSGNATTAGSAMLAAAAMAATNFSGSLAGDVTGTQGATVVASVGGQSATNVADAVGAANAATSSDTPGAIVRRNASGGFTAGAITASSISGDGAGLTNLNPGSLSAGTAAIDISGNALTATSATNVTGNIPDTQLSTNVTFLDGTNSFTGTNEFAGVTVATNTNNVIAGTFTGNLIGNATTASSAVTATTATTATTAVSAATATTANNFTGALLGQVVGTQGATTVLIVGGQSAANVASGASAANSATSLNTAATIVKRNSLGNFSAGAITATSVIGAFVGDGSGLTNVNASELTYTVAGNIDIGTGATSGDNGIIRIGTPGTQTNAFITGIYGVTAASGVAVYVTSSNQLGVLTSSRKFKEDIQSMDAASDALLALRPVTYRYKPEIDPAGVPQFGLVAEEVEKVNPDLVAHDAQGRPYTVRYEAVNAMLLNEFLKEHRRVEAQSAKIDELTQRLERLEKLMSQTAGKE